jgi:MFS family permease
VLAHFAHHLLTALPVPLLPFIRDDFALDYTQSALVVSAFTLSYGISQLPAGRLADRIGPRMLITIGISGVALAGLLVGLSQSYIMMLVFLVLMGLLGGGYHPSASPTISASVEPRNRGRALGLHMIGGSASYFLAPLIAAAIAATWGWRSPFIGLAIPAIGLGILFYVLLGRRAATKEVEHGTINSHKQAPSTPGRLRRLVSFLTLSTFTQALVSSIISFIPLFLVDHLGISKEMAAASIALIYSSGFWAGILGGYLSDYLGRIPIILVTCFVAGPVIYLLNLVSPGWSTAALLIIIGMIMYTRAPVSEAYIIDHTSERNRSTILGIYYFSQMEGSGVLTPAIGYLVDHFGFNTSFTITAIALFVVTLVCSIWLWGSRE